MKIKILPAMAALFAFSVLLPGCSIKNNADLMYMKDMEGMIIGYINSKVMNEEADELNEIKMDEAKDAAIQEIMKFSPFFFDNDYEYTSEGGESEDYYVYFYQVDENKNKTGCCAFVRVTRSGKICLIQLYHDNNTTDAADECIIKKETAIEIAYYAACEQMKIFKDQLEYQAGLRQTHPGKEEIAYNNQSEITGEPKPNEYTPFEIYLDNRENHIIKAKLIEIKERQIWFVEINNVENNTFDADKDTDGLTMNFTVTIDAHTGDIMVVGYSN